MSKLKGTLTLRGTRYFISLEENKTRQVWKLVSAVHTEDLMAKVTGKEPQFPVLNNFDIRNTIPLGYLLESMQRTKVSQKESIYRSKGLLTEVIELIGLSQSWAFAKDDIMINQSATVEGIYRREFSASDSEMVITSTRENGVFTKLYISHNGTVLDMREEGVLKIPNIPYTDLPKKKGKVRTSLSSISSLDFASLKEALDGLLWYEENGILKKRYLPIQTIKEFEEWVIDPLIAKLLEYRSKGLKLPFGVDTETTGLNFYDLSPENPDRDEIVAIPLAWERDQGVVIFLGMEHFGNVPMDYVFERLRPFIEYSSGHNNIEVRHVYDKDKGASLLADPPAVPDYVNLVNKKDSLIEYDWEVVDHFEFDREELIVVGHNSMFDGRVFYTYGIHSYWNDDTLQMAFNLNPRVVKGSNKLKVLSHRLFGVDTPELSDILGKGNEGDYKYITDLKVATIYGCADTDYTLLVREEELKATPPKMYQRYQQQDIPIMNRLFISEFKGLPIKMEQFIADGKIVEEDMKRLKKYLYKYVGRIVGYRNQVNALAKRFEAGALTEEEFLEAYANVKVDKEYEYEFELGGDDMRTVLFEILNYPKISLSAPTKKYPEGKPSIDKYVMEKLMKVKASTPSNHMKAHFMSCDENNKEPLIDKDKFNSFEYPIAYFLSVYKKLDKDWTSYYAPIMENNLEGRIFKSYSLARIETRRIMNAGQTMKASMKRNVISLGPDWYLADFDQMQVEPRIMISLSGYEPDIVKFKDPEIDYHTETAARVIGIPPHILTKKLRKQYKEISLGMPYGLGPHKMCERIHGDLSNRSLFETRKAIEAWEIANSHVVDKLMEFRKKGLIPAELPEGLRYFLRKTTEMEEDVPYGQATNLFGFYRLFDLSKVTDRKSEGKVMRPSGNFPIQSLAAEIFRTILMRFYVRCVEEGVEDKVVWHMLIHDELLMSVHKSVHPFLLYKMLYESCTVKLPGHTTYFIGINIGDSWADCKKDENEAPVNFVREVISKWDAGQFREDDYWNDEYNYFSGEGKPQYAKGAKAYVLRHMHKFICNRIGEVVTEIMPNCKEDPIDLKDLLSKFTKYTVRSYVLMHYKPNKPIKNEKDDDEVYESKFESWLIDYFGEGKELIGNDGSCRKIYRGSSEVINLFDEEEDSAVNDGYWTMDDEDLDELAFAVYDNDYIDEDDKWLSQFDTSKKGAKSLGELSVSREPSYDRLEKVNGQLFIKLMRSSHTAEIKEYLYDKRDSGKDGFQVVFRSPLGSQERWVHVKKDIDLEALNEFVGGLGYAYSNK